MEENIKEFLLTNLTITEFCKQKKIKITIFKEALRERGYIVQKSATANVIRYLHLAIQDYQTGQYSITQLSKKYNLARSTISSNLKKQNILIENNQNKTKFNENIFDVIDTEEKAY